MSRKALYKSFHKWRQDGGAEAGKGRHSQLANIAARLVDGRRFLNYLEYSSFWEADLITAARIYAGNPILDIWKHEPEGYQMFIGRLREMLLLIDPRVNDLWEQKLVLIVALLSFFVAASSN